MTKVLIEKIFFYFYDFFLLQISNFPKSENIQLMLNLN